MRLSHFFHELGKAFTEIVYSVIAFIVLVVIILALLH